MGEPRTSRIGRIKNAVALRRCDLDASADWTRSTWRRQKTPRAFAGITGELNPLDWRATLEGAENPASA